MPCSTVRRLERLCLQRRDPRCHLRHRGVPRDTRQNDPWDLRRPGAGQGHPPSPAQAAFVHQKSQGATGRRAGPSPRTREGRDGERDTAGATRVGNPTVPAVRAGGGRASSRGVAGPWHRAPSERHLPLPSQVAHTAGLDSFR